MAKNIGKIAQITGAVIDVRFDANLPEMLNALETMNNGKKTCFRSGTTLRRKHSALYRNGCN